MGAILRTRRCETCGTLFTFRQPIREGPRHCDKATVLASEAGPWACEECRTRPADDLLSLQGRGLQASGGVLMTAFKGGFARKGGRP